jgi:OOP family OmpA-OmpF porin
MKTNKLIAGILFATAATASGVACAADTNFYLGFSAGQARTNFDPAPAFSAGIPVTYDNSDSAWKVFAGYQFNQNFAIEGNYAKLGTYIANAGAPGITDVNVNAWGASLVGTLPLGKDVGLFAKGGMAYTRESRGTCSGICQTNTLFSANNVWSPTVGVGLKYDFHPNWNVRGEVERYTKIGSSDNTFGGTLNLYSVGLAYKF